MNSLKLITINLTILLISFNFIKNSVYCSIVNNQIDQYVNSDGECLLPDSLINEIKSYQPIVEDIYNQIVNGKYSGDTLESLTLFINKFGPRLSGTQNLEDAIDYMVEQFKKSAFDNVYTENALVSHWERGAESASLILPHKQNLPMLGLGSSIGTPRGGIIGDAIVVQSFSEFDKLSDQDVRGKIVIFVPEWEGYPNTVQYRVNSASIAAKKGAIAALVRSITPFSIGSPHTGAQVYADDVRKIPVACITVEDSYMLLDMYKRGNKISIKLEMEARNFNQTMSRNTIGEFVGSQKSIKSVVITSGHIDSWDVGTGAMDDGGGAFISWKAVSYLKQMNYIPKRTIRSILWTAEEVGLCGAIGYMEQHKATEKDEFNFFIESDSGTFEPTGLDFTGNKDAECIFKAILDLMKPMNLTQFGTPAEGGPDISLWLSRGFPGASLLNKNEQYFWYHHTNGDSLLVENSKNLDKGTALIAAAAFVIADLSIDMPKTFG